jgi:hypothetical protein
MPESKAKGLYKDPQCVKCGSKMRFSCTEPEPGKPGFVHHIYECIKCRSTQMRALKALSYWHSPLTLRSSN